MLKVILDTNVILSGILYGGTPLLLLKNVPKRKYLLCISEKLCEEVFEKLTNKFHVDQELLQNISDLLSYGALFSPKQKVRGIKDPKDAYLLELA